MRTTTMRRARNRGNLAFPVSLGCALLLLLVPEKTASGWRAGMQSLMLPLMRSGARAETFARPVAASLEINHANQTANATPPDDRSAAKIDALNSEIARLREALRSGGQSHDANEPAGIDAEVIARRAVWQERLLGLAKGTAEGAAIDAGVLHRGAVCGRIVAVAAHASSMALLTHHSMAIGARLADSRCEGVLHGQRAGEGERLCRLLVVARQQPGKVGEAVVTSGLDGVFPPGLPIGIVTRIRKTENFEWELTVRPAVDESSIECARVLTTRASEPPWPVK